MGSTTSHEVRRAMNSRRATIAATTSNIRPGEAAKWMYWTDPHSTTPQNVLSNSTPRGLPAGTTTGSSPSPSCHVTGGVHCGLLFGPVGPLLGPEWRSPQRPSYPIHAKESEG